MMGKRTQLSDTATHEGIGIHPADSALRQVSGSRRPVDQKRGRGSHVTLYLGDRLTIVRNPKDEPKAGTLHAMLKQLGLSLNDL
jgi:mRNA interferase HicA